MCKSITHALYIPISLYDCKLKKKYILFTSTSLLASTNPDVQHMLSKYFT